MILLRNYFTLAIGRPEALVIVDHVVNRAEAAFEVVGIGTVGGKLLELLRIGLDVDCLPMQAVLKEMADGTILSVTSADLDNDSTALDGVGIVDLVDGVILVGDGHLEMIFISDVAFIATVVLHAGLEEFLVVQHKRSGGRSSGATVTSLPLTLAIKILPLALVTFILPSVAVLPSVATTSGNTSGLIVATGYLLWSSASLLSDDLLCNHHGRWCR
mmetsp:Transcript_22813/g.65795  ORF Transcript_22813/g.65795 Transcript_22813/m.65795 type:complete len:216 (-) Transcript_22813:792-1439(-)